MKEAAVLKIVVRLEIIIVPMAHSLVLLLNAATMKIYDSLAVMCMRIGRDCFW